MLSQAETKCCFCLCRTSSAQTQRHCGSLRRRPSRQLSQPSSVTALAWTKCGITAGRKIAAMRGVAPAAISVCRALLLWMFLVCTQPGRTCVNGLLGTAPPNRLGRQLQAATLTDTPQPSSSGGMPSIGSPPVNGTIFGSSLGPGWAVKSLGSRGVRQQQVAGAVNNGSQAFCATLPAKDVSVLTCSTKLLATMISSQVFRCIQMHATEYYDAAKATCYRVISFLMHCQDEVFFSCQNCSQNGYRPFELNKTSGFELTVRRTNSDYSECSGCCCWQTCIAQCAHWFERA